MIKRIIATIIMVMAVITASAATAFADTDPDALIDWERKGSLYINYYDTTEGTDPISGAVFEMFKIATFTDGGAYKFLIDDFFIDPEQTTTVTEEMQEKVLEAYKGAVSGGAKYKTVTGSGGKADIQAIELGLYVVVETKPVEEHFATTPFFTSFPFTDNDSVWTYQESIEPKSHPAGDLIISKEVAGRACEKDRYFHFRVDLTKYDKPIHWTKSDGETGTVVSGESIALKHGESVVLDTIPVGTSFAVTEIEADQDGYLTTVSDSYGNIMRKIQKHAAFTNTKNPPVNTGDSYLPYVFGAAAVISLFIAILLLCKRKKDTEEEE